MVKVLCARPRLPFDTFPFQTQNGSFRLNPASLARARLANPFLVLRGPQNRKCEISFFDTFCIADLDDLALDEKCRRMHLVRFRSTFVDKETVNSERLAQLLSQNLPSFLRTLEATCD
jgi:hypothetical protein